MKQIIKGKEPPDLIKYRLSNDLNKSYENYRPKDSLKKSLLIEQGYICAFCMRRISEANMEIAHWEPIKVNPERQLDYKNHLASCSGNRGNSIHLQHCNAKQEDSLLTINPADFDRNCEKLIKFTNKGEIQSDDEDVKRDIQITLNLNVPTLVKNRRVALDTVFKQLNKLYPNKEWTENEIIRRIREWQSKDSRGYYNEYCKFVVYILEKRLSKKSS